MKEEIIFTFLTNLNYTDGIYEWRRWCERRGKTGNYVRGGNGWWEWKDKNGIAKKERRGWSSGEGRGSTVMIG